jgi:exonuclease III
LKPNLDIGASLQDLLNCPANGKIITPLLAQIDNLQHAWQTQVIRIYFQNVNGLRPSDNGADILDSFYHMHSVKADIFGFAETKLDCHNPTVQSLIHQNKSKTWNHCKISTSSSQTPWPTLHKPGGTLLGITGPLVGRIKSSFSDDLGRWTGMEFLGRDGRALVFICAYQVCQKSGWAGTYTAHSQQVSILRRRGFDNPNPRLHFINNLSSLVQHYHQANSDIILMGDFNEVIGLDLNGMAKVLQKGHLTNIQTYCHVIDSEESTYSRGPNRVDYIFSSDRLLPHIHRQGCEPFNARIFSDHRSIFVDITYSGIFDQSPNIMAPPSRCNLRYDCPSHVVRYLEFMSKYINDHSLTKRSIALHLSRNNDLAEAIDRDMTAGLLAADLHCKHYAGPP